MALASLLGGMVLANARLGAVHGLAGPLGGMFPAPHGMICARLLPLVMDANVRALKSSRTRVPRTCTFCRSGSHLDRESAATVDDGLAWLQALCADLAVPPLSHFGLSEHDIPQVVAQAQKASSMKGNPIELDEQDLIAILRRAL